MKAQFFQIFLELMITDIGFLITARGLQVNRLDGKWGIPLSFLFGKKKKDTKFQYLVLSCNLLYILAKICFIMTDYLKDTTSILSAILTILELTSQNRISICGFALLYVVEISTFIGGIYRLVPSINTINSDGNRHMSGSEIDGEYIQFSDPNRIDTRSTLVLIAGDLSFLGDVPCVSDIRRQRSRNKCQETLKKNTPPHRSCKRTCPAELQCTCVEKSGQFTQLINLKSKEITLHIICKSPKESGDDAYKRRLGRLKKIFGENLHIHFMSDDLAGGICILGRIKCNGGIEELFWHWKDPEHPGQYTVPNTKRADTSENKTLIYLLKDVLWNYTDEADVAKIADYVEKYETAIRL